MTKSNEETLNSLHSLVAKDLIKKIKSGEATAQDINAAIKFLKDNDIKADLEFNDPLNSLNNLVHIVPEDLPFTAGDANE